MDQEQAEQDHPALGVDPVTPKPGKGTRIGAIVLLVLIVVSLLWYFAADRLTPYSSQARAQGASSCRWQPRCRARCWRCT